MAEDKAELIFCVVCGERVAEVVLEDGRVLCSVCLIEEMGLPWKPATEDDGSDEGGAD